MLTYSRERAICWKAFIPLAPNRPWSPSANCGAVPALMEEKESCGFAAAKLGGTAEPFGPFAVGAGGFFVLY